MDTRGKILVAVDPTAEPDQPCVRRANLLAKAWNAEVELLVCHYDQYLSGERFFDSAGLKRSRIDAIQNRHSFLTKVAEPLRDDGIPVTTTAIWDNPLDDGIVRHVARTQPKILIKDTHYHSAIARAIFTNTDWGLIRTCPVPVWLAKTTEWPHNPLILAAVDPLHTHDKPAELDNKILEIGRDAANSLKGDLHVIHTHPVISYHLAMNPELLSESLTKMDQDIEDEHRAAMDELLKPYDVDPTRRHFVAGEAANTLPGAIDNLGANLVIMGAVSRKPVERVLLGNTAEKILDRVSSDLLIVKPNWFKTSVKQHEPEIVESSSTPR